MSDARADAAEPQFGDALFRRKRRNGAWEVVDAPELGVLIADTHAHIHMLQDPALALARAGMHQVAFIEMIVDPSEDGTRPFDELYAWQRSAGVYMHRMAPRTC